jgi:serine/threonine protein kinase
MHFAAAMSTATLPLGLVDGNLLPLPRASRRSSRFGDFDIVAPIASGGMGGVYLALHARTGERVALKVLDPQFADHPEIVLRLHAEHTLASRIRHPGIVQIRGSALTTDRIPYLVMEYLVGETLAELSDGATLELPAIIAICAQTAAALAALHDAGVVHCDVKHENLFVTNRLVNGWPRIKVIDFGVSRLVSEPPRADAAVAGTPWCIAPEQWRGAPCTASDVYSLGCLLYDLTTGHPPFDGSLPELMTAHLERRPARPSWVRRMPIELERLILSALAKHPADRPAMHDVALGLGVLADDRASELRAAG